MYNGLYLVIQDYMTWPKVQPMNQNKNTQKKIAASIKYQK